MLATCIVPIHSYHPSHVCINSLYPLLVHTTRVELLGGFALSGEPRVLWYVHVSLVGIENILWFNSHLWLCTAMNLAVKWDCHFQQCLWEIGSTWTERVGYGRWVGVPKGSKQRDCIWARHCKGPGWHLVGHFSPPFQDWVCLLTL